MCIPSPWKKKTNKTCSSSNKAVNFPVFLLIKSVSLRDRNVFPLVGNTYYSSWHALLCTVITISILCLILFFVSTLLDVWKQFNLCFLIQRAALNLLFKKCFGTEMPFPQEESYNTGLVYFKHNESKCVLVIPGRQLLYSNGYVRGSKYFLRRDTKNKSYMLLNIQSV